MFKIGFLANGNMREWEPEKLCGYIKNAGYEAIELIDDVVFAEGKTSGDYKKTAAAAKANGLVISEILLQHDFVLLDKEARKANVDLVIRNMNKALETGVNTVNLFTGPEPWAEKPLTVNKNIPASLAWDYVFEAFDRILPVAEKNKIRVAVENVFGMLCHDFYTNMYLNKHYNSPWLGVNLDPSHDVLYGNTDMKFLINGWGKDKIFHVHLKDAVGVPEFGKFVFPVMGEGIVDWQTFFSEMKKIGYGGCMSVEFESSGYRSAVWGGRHEESANLSRKIIKEIAGI